jgi:GTP-binding protein Era
MLIDPAPELPADFRAGTVTLVGRPNAGKSSLLNALLGERIAAVSHRPQTTRNRVVGIHSTERFQVVLLDTPGLHEARTPLNTSMIDATAKAIEEATLITWIVDCIPLVEAAQKGHPILSKAMQAISDQLPANALVALNKIDKIADKSWLLPVIGVFAPRMVIPISTLSKDGLEPLLAAWEPRLPIQPPLHPTDIYTDATEKFVVAELIREQVFEMTNQEIPYATAVEVEQFDESERETEGKVHIHARIIVEKPGQKAIVIGKGGQMIKRIGTQARKAVEHVLDCHVYLELFVVVEPGWTSNPRILRELGYKPPKPVGKAKRNS